MHLKLECWCTVVADALCLAGTIYQVRKQRIASWELMMLAHMYMRCVELLYRFLATHKAPLKTLSSFVQEVSGPDLL